MSIIADGVKIKGHTLSSMPVIPSMAIPTPRLFPNWKLEAARKAEIPIRIENHRPYVSATVCKIDLSLETPNRIPIEVYITIEIPARMITHKKAYPCSDPIREDTVILPGPNTTEAMIKPGPIDFINFFIKQFFGLPHPTVPFSFQHTTSEPLNK